MLFLLRWKHSGLKLTFIFQSCFSFTVSIKLLWSGCFRPQGYKVTGFIDPFVFPTNKGFLLLLVLYFFLLCLKSPAALNSCLQDPAVSQSCWYASEPMSDQLAIASQQTKDSGDRLCCPKALFICLFIYLFSTNVICPKRNLKHLG